MPVGMNALQAVEKALEHAPERTRSGRFAVYVPDAVVIGTYDDLAQAQTVADEWAGAVGDVVVVVDRGTAA
jgi:hypothetical protein